jgi:hypothetical protein
MQVERLQDGLAEAAPVSKEWPRKKTRLLWIFDRFRSR